MYMGVWWELASHKDIQPTGPVLKSGHLVPSPVSACCVLVCWGQVSGFLSLLSTASWLVCYRHIFPCRRWTKWDQRHYRGEWRSVSQAICGETSICWGSQRTHILPLRLWWRLPETLQEGQSSPVYYKSHCVRLDCALASPLATWKLSYGRSRHWWHFCACMYCVSWHF